MVETRRIDLKMTYPAYPFGCRSKTKKTLRAESLLFAEHHKVYLPRMFQWETLQQTWHWNMVCQQKWSFLSQEEKVQTVGVAPTRNVVYIFFYIVLPFKRFRWMLPGRLPICQLTSRHVCGASNLHFFVRKSICFWRKEPHVCCSKPTLSNCIYSYIYIYIYVYIYIYTVCIYIYILLETPRLLVKLSPYSCWLKIQVFKMAFLSWHPVMFVGAPTHPTDISTIKPFYPLIKHESAKHCWWNIPFEWFKPCFLLGENPGALRDIWMPNFYENGIRKVLIHPQHVFNTRFWLVVYLPLSKMMEFVSWNYSTIFPIYGKS